MSVRVSIAQRGTDTACAETRTVDYYLCGDTLIIASATIPGRLYVVTSTDCSCPLGLQEWPCAHATLRLNLLAPTPTSHADTYVDMELQ